MVQRDGAAASCMMIRAPRATPSRAIPETRGLRGRVVLVANTPTWDGQPAMAAATTLPWVPEPDSSASQVSPLSATAWIACSFRCRGPTGFGIVVVCVAVCEKFGVSRLSPLSVTATICGGTASVPSLIRCPSPFVSIPPPSTPMSWYGRAPCVSSTFPTSTTLGASELFSRNSLSSCSPSTSSSPARRAASAGLTSATSSRPSPSTSTCPGPATCSTPCRRAPSSSTLRPFHPSTCTRSIRLSARRFSTNGIVPRLPAIFSPGWYGIAPVTHSSEASPSRSPRPRLRTM